jgi:hypothetical protein
MLLAPNFLLFICSGDGIQGLERARPVLYHLSQTPSFSNFCFVLFFETGPHYAAQAGLKPVILLLSLPSAGTTGVHHQAQP